MTKKSQNICVITGTRAEYGLLYWLMKEIEDDTDLILQVAVTGMHLSSEFGDTWKLIEEDGFNIDAKIYMDLSGDDDISIVKATGNGVIGFADTFDELKPDCVIVLGDRFEILAAAQSAMLMKIPIAHIHGGEITEGAIDESIRHSITKMAHLHFTSTEAYRKRVIQLGEVPERVFNVGAPGLDNLQRLELLDEVALEKSLNFNLSSPLFLVTYHPETLGSMEPSKALEEMLNALDHFSDANIIITLANSDAGGRAINQRLVEYAARENGRVKLVSSLGQVRYLSLLCLADVVIGNSSSGIIEAPSARTPTVNIGSRQKGRLRAPSVIDCDDSEEAIVSSITKCMSHEMKLILSQCNSPYGKSDNVAHEICKVLKMLLVIPIKKLVQKKFHDISL